MDELDDPNNLFGDNNTELNQIENDFQVLDFRNQIMSKLNEILIRISVLENEHVLQRVSTNFVDLTLPGVNQHVDTLEKQGLPATMKKKLDWFELELLKPDFMRSIVSYHFLESFLSDSTIVKYAIK